MAAKKSKFSVYTLSAIGVMTAVSFISNFISIPIGTLTRIHMGNVFCPLSGILLGHSTAVWPAALVHSFMISPTRSMWQRAPITLFNKFFIGFLAGLISHRGGHYGEKASLNFVGALAGNLAYTALFYLKNFISEYFLLHLEMNTIMANLMVRLTTSALQIPLTLIVTMLLASIFLKAIQKAGIHRKLFPEHAGGNSAA